MSEQKLCYGCMEPIGDGKECEHCGYKQNTSPAENRLMPGTVLHERYLIGKEIRSNGEGVTYIAYDKTVGCKVMVREYLPEQICSRSADSTLVNVDYDHLAQYKALMAEYTELNKALARLRSLSHLNPALDLISENNTTYAVFEYLEGRTLLEYLKENAGELSWNTVRRIFPPLFTSLSLLHNAGVLHRGISPETIYVTDKGELKLGGFCISAVRTHDTELEAELFDGYAAPEQYFADRQQGSWTDVYGICAVLYRILTGCRATDANARQDFDNLIPPNDMNPHVPEKVSDAIMQGLELDGRKRIQTITDLVTKLFGDLSENGEDKVNATIQFNPSEAQNAANVAAARRQEEVHRAEGQVQSSRNSKVKTQQHEPTVFERLRAPLLVAVLFLLIIGIIIVAFKKLLNPVNSDSDMTSTSMSSVRDNVDTVSTADTTRSPVYDAIMPGLVGMNYRIKRDDMAGFINLEAEYVFSETVQKDQIMWQEIEEGEPFVSGSTVKVKVSRGTSIIEIPEYNGYRLQTYLDKLEELGFVKGVEDPNAAKKNNNKNSRTTTATTTTTTVTTTTADPNAPKRTITFKPTVNYRYANGNVCGVDPKPGTKIDVLKEYDIVVYYANNPVVTTSSSTSSKWGTTVTTTGGEGGGSSAASWSAGGNSGSTTSAQQQTSVATKATQVPATTKKAAVTTAAGE